MQFSKLLLFALPAALAAPLVAPRGAIGYTGSNIITVVDASSNRAVGYLNSNGAFTVSRGEAAVFQATPAYSGGSVVSTPKGPCGFDPGRSYDLACDSSGKGTYADAYPFYGYNGYMTYGNLRYIFYADSRPSAGQTTGITTVLPVARPLQVKLVFGSA